MRKTNIKRTFTGIMAAVAMAFAGVAPTTFNSTNTPHTYSITANAATRNGNTYTVSFDEINNPAISLPMPKGETECTIYSAAILARRVYCALGESWNVSYPTLKKYLDTGDGGLKYNSTINISGKTTLTINRGVLTGNAEQKKQKLIEALKAHPEGIIGYDSASDHRDSIMHAQVITDYTNGQFYCEDPSGHLNTISGGSNGREPISKCTVQKFEKFDRYYYCDASGKKIVIGNSTPTQPVVNNPVGDISLVPYTKYLAKGTAIYKDAGSSTVNQYLSVAGTYTIIKEKTVNSVKYGYLKSGAGWVKL